MRLCEAALSNAGCPLTIAGLLGLVRVPQPRKLRIHGNRTDREHACSILALQSCEGFAPNKFHMWCCTELQCNILYTKQGLEDLGFSTADIGALDVIQCYSAEQSPSTSAASPSVGTGGTHPDGEAASIAPDLSAAPARGRAMRAVHAALWAVLAVLASTARLL